MLEHVYSAPGGFVLISAFTALSSWQMFVILSDRIWLHDRYASLITKWHGHEFR